MLFYQFESDRSLIQRKARRGHICMEPRLTLFTVDSNVTSCGPRSSFAYRTHPFSEPPIVPVIWFPSTIYLVGSLVKTLPLSSADAIRFLNSPGIHPRSLLLSLHGSSPDVHGVPWFSFFLNSESLGPQTNGIPHLGF